MIEMTQGLVNILMLFSSFHLCIFEHTLLIWAIFFQSHKGVKIVNNTSIYNKIETEFSIINDANSLISIAVRGINTDGSLCTLNGFTASKKLMELVFMELKHWRIYSS
ncbi:TPA_asm: hypothetical protein GIP81_04730 [Listeria monocytogenes]|nr:hypothetical protein [Listeria monocytogenes]